MTTSRMSGSGVGSLEHSFEKKKNSELKICLIILLFIDLGGKIK